MTYLNFSDIIYLVKEVTPPLIENIDEYQVKTVQQGGIGEGPCVEVRIGNVFVYDANEMPILSYDYPSNEDEIVRYIPEAKLFVDYKSMGLGKELILSKGQSLVIETIEKINLPNSSKYSILAQVEPRFSLSRMGILMLKSDADPGYSGKMVFRLINVGPFKFVKLTTGTRIAKVRFVNVAGENPPYVGQYGGKPGGVLEKKKI